MLKSSSFTVRRCASPGPTRKHSIEQTSVSLPVCVYRCIRVCVCVCVCVCVSFSLYLFLLCEHMLPRTHACVTLKGATEHVVAACIMAGASRLVHISSPSIYFPGRGVFRSLYSSLRSLPLSFSSSPSSSSLSNADNGGENENDYSSSNNNNNNDNNDRLAKERRRGVREDFPLPPPFSQANAYAESKLRAERVVRRASCARGLEVSFPRLCALDRYSPHPFSHVPPSFFPFLLSALLRSRSCAREH